MTVTSTNYTYKVTLIPKQGGYASETEITDFVLGLPALTDTGGVEFNSGRIELRSPFGEFLTVAPILKDNDHIRVVITDEGGNTYDREFEYAPLDQSLEISESKGAGRIITLNVEGIEYHTGKVHYIKPIYRDSGFNTAKDIGDIYNVSKGSDQPTMVNHGTNGLPKTLIHAYPYADTPTPCKDRFYDLATSFGAPPEAGGIQDFFTVGFDTGGGTFNQIGLVMKSLGSTPASPILIEEGTLATDEDDRQTSLSPAEANRIIGQFGAEQGSLPTGFEKFVGLNLRHRFLPYWDNTVAYFEKEQVRDPSNTDVFYPAYEAKIAVPAGTALSNTTYWQPINYFRYVGETQYSPWTHFKSTQWKNNGVDPGDTTTWGRAMPDFNLAIHTDDFFRTTVDYVANNFSSVPNELLYPGREPYRGFRVLVNDGEGTEFSPFTNAVVQYDGSAWRVRYQFSSANTQAQVIDMCTGNAFAFAGTRFVQDFNSHTRDCLHPYNGLENVTGYVSGADSMINNIHSAIEVTYNIPSGVGWLVLSALDIAFSSPTSIQAQQIATIQNGGYGKMLNWQYKVGGLVVSTQTNFFGINRHFYRAGVSLHMRFPFPTTTFGGIGEDVGELYGGSNATGREPATIDVQNNHFTHDGKRGYNTTSSDDLGQMHGIGFAMRIRVSDIVTDNLDSSANMAVRCAIRDTSDHVIYQDFIVPFNNLWSSQILPFSGFKPYRAVKPRDFKDIIVPVQQVEEFDEFEWNNIKDVTWTMLRAYDDAGRFNVLGSQAESVLAGITNILNLPNTDIISAFVGRRVRMAIDGVRFVKHLIVVSDPDPKINQEKVINLPDIIDRSSAEYFIKSEEERLKFPKRELIIDVRGRCDIKYGDSIRYKNEQVFGTDPLLLAVQRVEHSIVPDLGFRTRLYCSHRFTTI